MSTHADATKTRLWLDGDAFRGAAGLELPAASLWAPTPAGMDPFGAIRAGFKRGGERETREMSVWNVRGTYRTGRGNQTDQFEFEPVDLSKATVLTMLRGGSLASVDGATDAWEWVEGEDEEFSLLMRAIDPVYGMSAWFAERATLTGNPEENIDGQDIAGHPLVIRALPPASGGQPIRKFSNTNLLAPAA